jgi:transposase-like protein
MAHCCDARKRGREAWAKWRGLVSEQGRSGQGVTAFCRERGFCASQFFAWKKRLSQAAAGQFVEVQVVGAGAAAQPTAAQSRAMEVRLGGGRCVLVEPGFDAGHLRAVLAALETRA